VVHVSVLESVPCVAGMEPPGDPGRQEQIDGATLSAHGGLVANPSPGRPARFAICAVNMDSLSALEMATLDPSLRLY